MKKQNIAFTLIFLFSLYLSPALFGQMDRSTIDDKYKWDLTDIYETEEAWQKSKEEVVAKLSKIEEYKGKLTTFICGIT